MLSSWAFCLATVLLVPASGTDLCAVQNGTGDTSTLYTSFALESLHCQNDYKTHINCSWTESEQTHERPLLSLYHCADRHNSKSRCASRESLCVPHRLPVPLPDGRVTVHCRHNTTRFAIGTKDSFFFKTAAPCPPALTKTLTPLQHVRPGPPRNLTQQAVKGGGVLLEWQAPPSIPRSRPHYQLTYRPRSSQAWTEVVVSEQGLKIEAESLVPGCDYEARVRVREGTGPWSEWSPTVVWKSQDALLQCVFDRQEMLCSWEVQRELAELVTYRLSYRLNHTSPAEWCSVSGPPGARGPAHSVLRFSCSFSVWDPKQPLELELLPTYNSKEIRSHRNIQPSPPDPGQVTERDRDWVLNWTPPENKCGTLSYQLRYWSTEKPESVEYVNCTEGVRSYFIKEGSLLPSTHYAAQVRALIVPKEGEDSFMGPPSEWSERMEWTSHPAPWSISTFVYICIAVLVAIIFIILCFTLPACRRRLVLWKVSVPSPIRSKVLEEIMKKSYRDRLSLQKDPLSLQKEAEKTIICRVQVLEKVCLPSSDGGGDTQELANGNSQGPCWEKDPKSATLGPPGPPRQGCFNFSGPYILCPSDSPSDPQPRPDRFLFQPPSLGQPGGGYVCTPPPQGAPGPDRAAQERGRVRDGYVVYPGVLMGDPPPKPSPGPPDCAPPAYTAVPDPFPGASVPGGPDGRGRVTDYVRLSEPFSN